MLVEICHQGKRISSSYLNALGLYDPLGQQHDHWYSEEADASCYYFMKYLFP